MTNDPGCEGQTKEFALGYALRRSDALLRFWLAGANGTHAVTAGAPPAEANYEFGLGFLLAEGGTGRHAIYGCLSGSADHFLSLDPGARVATGWAARATPTTRRRPPSRPRLSTAARSPDRPLRVPSSDCEGQRTEANLGYLRTYGDALHPYAHPANGISWATPGLGAAGFPTSARSVSWLQTGGPNLQALYGCRTHAATTSSRSTPPVRASAARAATASSTPPPPARGHRRGLPLPARWAAALRLARPGCGGATTEARLGYLRTAEGGAPPPPACSPSAARLQIGLGKRTARTIRYGGTATLSGDALTRRRPGRRVRRC